jgi:hypothetical protein
MNKKMGKKKTNKQMWQEMGVKGDHVLHDY